MWKTISIGTLNLFALLFAASVLTSCAGNAPRMERPVSVWNGAPEKEAICRLAKEPATALIKSQAAYEVTQQHAGTIVRYALKDGRTMECIPAKSAEFKRYGCMAFDDLGVIQRYIERLNFSCAKWKDGAAAVNGVEPLKTQPAAEKLTDERLEEILAN